MSITPSASPLIRTDRLTSWERDQLESIGLLFKQVVSTKQDLLMKNQQYLREEPPDINGCLDWLKFREVMIDLHTILDYTYFLLYCHFDRKGEPDHSHATAMLCRFPYKSGGIKFRETKDSDDQRQQKTIQDYNQEEIRKFKTKKPERFKFISKNLGEGSHFWIVITDVILAVQPKLSMQRNNKGGLEAKECGKQVPKGEAESFAILHYFRNCATHRGIIKFYPEEMAIEVNQTTKEIKLAFAKDIQSNNTCESYYLGKGYCVFLPEDVTSTQQSCYRLLEGLLDQVVNFVKNTTHKLLSAAFLLDGMNGDLLANFTPSHEFDIQPFPQVSLEMNNDVLLFREEFIQKMKDGNFIVKDNYPFSVYSKPNYFKGTYKLIIKYDDKDLIKLSSKEFEKRSKDDVERAGVKEVLEESIRLGIIKIY